MLLLLLSQYWLHTCRYWTITVYMQRIPQIQNERSNALQLVFVFNCLDNGLLKKPAMLKTDF